jgi:hypothetical protein
MNAKKMILKKKLMLNLKMNAIGQMHMLVLLQEMLS